MNEIATKQEQLQEAIRRAKALHMDASVVKGLEEGKLFYSERMGRMFPAVLYWLDNKPELIAKAREIEADGGMVWHAVMTHLVDGDMVDFLVISKYRDDWKQDGNGECLSYCSSPYADEYGIIGIRPAMGGIERVW